MTDGAAAYTYSVVQKYEGIAGLDLQILVWYASTFY